VDLATAAAWLRARSELRVRVIAERSMPPRGHDLADADRSAIRAWLDAAD
jgi:hypothetical protein